MKRIKKSNKVFLLLAPILLILGIGVLLTSQKRVKASFACNPSDFSGNFDKGEKIAVFGGEKIEVPSLAEASGKSPILGVAAPGERWIEVDLSEQRLRAWEGNQLFLETPVSSGLPWWPTPTGEFRIWIKLRYTKMEGGSGRYYYYLPNVPYVMYFENDEIPGYRGYGLHGTYWHNDFGTQRSHGCVNLPTSVAERLFYWTSPIVPTAKGSVRSSEGNPGTRIVIHD